MLLLPSSVLDIDKNSKKKKPVSRRHEIACYKDLNVIGALLGTGHWGSFD
jgi:hypothetical protein